MSGTFQGIRGNANGLASLDSNALVPTSQLGALSQKNSCQVATTANIATLTGLLTIDGYTILAGDRVLVKNQTDSTQNGIYIASASTWTRSSDFSTTGEAIAGAYTFIENGTIQASTGWLCTTSNNPVPVIGTSNITFVQFSGQGTYSAGTGLTLTDTTFSLDNASTTSLGGVIVPTSGNLTVDGSGNISIPQSVATSATPTFASETLTANTNQLTLGTTNTTTLTMETLSASRIVTFPDANSNTIQPLGSATANQWVAYIDNTGTQNLTQPAFSNISGTAAIAQGGTNSSTALANNSLMYSSGGQIIELGNASNGQIPIGTSSGAPTLANITGTTDQVTVTNGAGSITLSLPQSIAVTSTPTFSQGTITNTPVNPTDIANKLYVDSVAQGLDIKNYCVAATTSNITLSGTQTIDGYNTIVGDRILVKNQTTNTQNGIYIVSATTWTRSADFALGSNEIGAFTFVQNGTMNASTGWVCTEGSNVGTTPTLFTQFSGAGTYTAGDGLTLTATEFSLNNATTTSLGGVIVPSSGNLTVDGSGNIGVPVATNLVLGVSSPDNTTITATTGTYTAVTATTSNKGIVQPDGTTVTISSGTISVPTGTELAKGILQVGTNISVAAGTISIPQSVATTATPTFASQTLTANTNQLILGTTSTTTLTMAALTANRTVTLPDANSNTIVPSTAATNQFATGISATGIIAYAQPQQQNIKINVLTESTNYTMASTDNKVVLTTTGLTVQLPTVASAPIGQEYTVQLYNVATGTLIPNSLDTGVNINGLSTITMAPYYGSFTVYTPDNAQWLLA